MHDDFDEGDQTGEEVSNSVHELRKTGFWNCFRIHSTSIKEAGKACRSATMLASVLLCLAPLAHDMSAKYVKILFASS